MGSRSIATVAKHIVPADQRLAFEDWVRGIDRASRGFPGYQGMEHIHSRGSSEDEHFCVFRFDTDDHLAVWMSSRERADCLKDENAFSAEIFTARPYSSLQFWFSPPGASRNAPSDFKTVATFLVIWPLVHFIAPLMALLVSSPHMAEVLTVAVICALVTYVFMPIVTRLFGWWLFK